MGVIPSFVVYLCRLNKYGMKTNFEKAKNIIIGQTEIMKKDELDENFIKQFNEETIKSLSEKFKFNEEEITKLKEL